MEVVVTTTFSSAAITFPPTILIKLWPEIKEQEIPRELRLDDDNDNDNDEETTQRLLFMWVPVKEMKVKGRNDSY